jgi:hypothetical protein
MLNLSKRLVSPTRVLNLFDRGRQPRWNPIKYIARKKGQQKTGPRATATGSEIIHHKLIIRNPDNGVKTYSGYFNARKK